MAIGRIGGVSGGDTILETYRYNASGGETSVSGADASGKTLTYPANYEAVFLNGVRLARGLDYTATTGSSITGLAALKAGDIVEIAVLQSLDVVQIDYADVRFSAEAPTNPVNGTVWIDSDATVNVADYVEKTVVDAKGDLIVGTADDSVSRLAVGANNHRLVADSATATGLKWAAEPVVLAIAVSDETTNITTGTAKVTFRMPFAMTVTTVRASLSTASSSGNPTFDINENGTSILGTNKLSIDANEKTSTTAATATSISDSALADDAEITIDIDTAGTGAKGAKVYIIGTRA